MLTLKKPIQLKSGLKLSTAADSFYHRLCGNYEIINSRMAPKDLLFLLTQPPQIPEELFGATQLNITNSVTDARRVTIETVNNLVNRILLSTQPNFTYQDNVYITTMLNRLGITDVKQFMREIRRVKAEQEDQLELTRLYKKEISRTVNRLKTTHPQQNITVTSAEKGSEKPIAPVQRYYLHQEIYDRLETGDLYQEVNSLHQSFIRQNNSLTRNELQLAEQLRVSRDLALTDARKSYFQTNAPTMEHHINHYERGDILLPPTTEDEVLSQAAQAALFSTVERVITQTLARTPAAGGNWLNISRSLHQTAENSLRRFESWHSDTTVNHYSSESYNDWRRSMTSQEINTLRQLDKTNTELVQLEHITAAEPQQYDTASPAASVSEISRLITERTNELKRTEHEFRAVEQHFEEQPAITEKQTVLKESAELISRELREIDRQNRERLEKLQLVRERTERAPRLTPPDSKRIMRDALRALESPEAVLSELAAQPKKEKAVTGEVERILSHTDSATRQIIEAVMKYERDPAAAIREGAIKANDIASLNAEVATRQRQPAVTEYLEPAVSRDMLERSAEQTAKALEQLSERSAERQPQQKPLGRWNELPMVFRRESNSIVDELVERLEEQRTQNVQRQNIHEDVIRQNVSQTEIHDKTQRVVAHTAEDITEIVNRQMARQMNVLTDQVYRQMERKLQTERVRRGRF